MTNHCCVQILERDTDWFKGANSQVVFRATTNGDWEPWIDFFERQKIGFETDACVLFTAHESFDAQINRAIDAGELPQSMLDEFSQMGYMDTGLDGKLHFHSSPRFLHVIAGTKHDGAPLQTPWDVMRDCGCLPWKDLPFDEDTTEQEYFAAIPQPLLDKAKHFLALIGGKDAIQYHWVGKKGLHGTPILQMKNALQQAPLCIGTAACEPWDQLQPPSCDSIQPQHSTMVYHEDPPTHILDHYIPFKKVLDRNYNIAYIMQGVLTIKIPPPPAPILPDNPTTPQVSNWLTALAVWLQQILAWIKGRSNH